MTEGPNINFNMNVAELREQMREQMRNIVVLVSLLLRAEHMSYDQKMDLFRAAIDEFRDSYSTRLLAAILVEKHNRPEADVERLVAIWAKAALTAWETSHPRVCNLAAMLEDK